jgi:cytoskeleton protein RodZ
VSIGTTLAQARESAGLSIDEVAHSTRIRRTLLLGIEADDFSACGGDFYARGHVRTIALKLGVDPVPLLHEFDAARPPESPRTTDVFEPERARPERRGPNWSAAMAVALVLIVGFGVVQAFSGDDGKGKSPLAGGPTASSTSSAEPPSSTPSPSESGGGAVAQAPRSKVKVDVRATEKSWVQVTTGAGQELFQGLMDVGMTRSFSDKRQLRLVIGNAGGIELTVNGTDIGATGRRGQVARLQFTPQDPSGA